MRDFDWQILVTLHKTHNISKTAELLYVSQPTLTKRIQVIEDELGIPLIVRSRKGSVFTAEGERIAQKAESIVAAIQEIKEDVAKRNKGAKGVLRLGVPYSYVRYVLPALMAEYVKTRPGVEFDVITGLSDELTRRVEDDSLDLTFARYRWRTTRWISPSPATTPLTPIWSASRSARTRFTPCTTGPSPSKNCRICPSSSSAKTP